MRRVSLLMFVVLSLTLSLSGCAWKKSHTLSQSDATITDTKDANLLPMKFSGTKSINMVANGLSIEDNGMHEVFVQDADKDNLAQQIITWLMQPSGDPSLLTARQLKQASVSVGWTTLTVPWWATLAPHLVAYNASVKSSGDDLIIQASLTNDPYESYLVVKDSLPESYMITNPQNWFWPSIYMIPQKTYSLLKFQWGSSLQGASLFYESGDTSRSLGSVYEDRWSGLATAYDLIVVPGATKMRLVPSTFSSQARVFHLTLWPIKGNMKQEAFLSDVSKVSENKRWLWQLTSYLENQKQEVREREPIEANQSGERLLMTSNAEEQLLLVIESASIFLLPIHKRDFTIAVNQNVGDEYRPYYSQFVTDYQLDEHSVDTALKNLFGEKNYSYEPWSKSFTYQIQPQKAYKQSLIIKNIFGQEKTVDVSYYIDAIDKRAITQDIVSNDTISILPKSWSFKDVLIQYKNIEKFPISFQSCTIQTSANIVNDYKGVGIENYLFDCKGKIVQKEIRPQGEVFTYWKAYRTPLPVPEEFAENIAFKVFFTDQQGKEQSHYMLKSDIWLRTKLTEDNKVYVRGLMLDDGTPVSDATLTLTNLASNKPIATSTMTNWFAQVTLPEVNYDAYDYSTHWKEDLYLLQVSRANQSTFVVLHRRWRDWFQVPAPGPDGYDRNLTINSRLELSEVLPQNLWIDQWSTIQPIKIYGYTDKWLYKAGETINLAGRVRNVMKFDSLEYLKDKVVTVNIFSPTSWSPITTIGKIPLDSYGWFVASYTLPSTLTLGDYVVEYGFEDANPYSHNIKIEEYQKPTFYADITHQTQKNTTSLVIQPSYYFGTPLQSYDAQVTRSLVGKDICRYCWRRNNQDYYYNHVFNDTISTGGTIALYNQNATLTVPLYREDIQENKGYQYSLKIDAIIKDHLSDETQFFTRYVDFKPEVMLWLDGQPYEWQYRDWISRDPRTTRKIHAKLKEGKSLVDSLSYEVYRMNYEQTLQQGVDGNLYYINGQWYIPVASGDIAVSDTMIVPSQWIDKPWEYFMRVMAKDKNGAIIAEVQKKVWWYESSSDTDLLGVVPNNYALTVDIPKKTYEEWQSIPINIAPYQSWAQVVVTVERGQYILDSFMKKLDGQALHIVAKKDYAPNVVVSVMMLQPTQLNTSTRQEPRFFAGFAEAEIDSSVHTLNISVTSDKKEYSPGDRVELTIKTTNSGGTPIDARVSVSVVDKALLSLYELIKEPIPYFFNKVGTSIINYTNMKLLYQSLKAFATGGAKWWGGQGGKAMFSYIRDDLKDTAFWSWAVYTKDGEARISFIAPENLTTWLVDAIGISMDTKLGTKTSEFVVKKDLIIEANPPLFVTIGDELMVPVKLIVPSDSKKSTIEWSARIENQQGERVMLWSFAAKSNSSFALKVAIPSTRRESQYIKLIVQWWYGDTKDGIEHIIPLRTEGLIARDSVWLLNKSWKHTFQIPESITQKSSIRFSQIPSNIIDPVAKYLVHYPYGCTEQILSSILPLVALQKLQSKGLITSSLILSGTTIATEEGPVEITTALRDGIAKLLANQNSNGGFGYWSYSTDNTVETVSRSDYILSAYVYSSLRLLQTVVDKTVQLDMAIERLEWFLDSYRTVAAEWRYRYLLAKVQNGDSLTTDQQGSLNDIAINDTTYLPLLRYIIAVAQQDSWAMKKRKPVANVPTNQENWSDTSIFLNQVTAEAMKLQALLDDGSATQQERLDLLQSLLRRRETNGLWWRSTQSNLQVLLAISKMAELRNPKDTIQCTVNVNGQQQKLVVKKAAEATRVPALSGKQHTIERSCDAPLLADISLTYLPKKMDDVLGAASHVSAMSWSVSNPSAWVWETVDIIGSFSTDMVGEQVAVELFIPSDYKLLDVISSKKQQPDSWSQYPFTTSDRHCTPTHRETRFDRLFLYYDILEPGVCDITIPALKAYSWSTVVMPMRVREMYRWKVNGRKVIHK